MMQGKGDHARQQRYRREPIHSVHYDASLGAYDPAQSADQSLWILYVFGDHTKSRQIESAIVVAVFKRSSEAFVNERILFQSLVWIRA